jgi:hypothetical protein
LEEAMIGEPAKLKKESKKQKRRFNASTSLTHQPERGIEGPAWQKEV